MIHILQALLLGVIEGVTEFLPISSTGHLLISQELMNFKDSHELFAVVIQLGAIAAVVWYYRQDLWQKSLGLLRREAVALNFWKILASKEMDKHGKISTPKCSRNLNCLPIHSIETDILFTLT